MASSSPRAPKDDVRLFVVGLYFRGQRHEDLERDYIENYHSIDERVPRFRQLPSSRLVHATDLYTAEELKTSPSYNELMHRAVQQDSLNVPALRAGRLPHRLVPERSRRLGWLGVVADRDGPAAHAPCPSIHPRPAGAGPRPGGGHDRDRPAREPSDRHPPPGPARADPGGE